MIKSIRIKNFRNIIDQKIEFSNGLNIICGGNGEGKTSLFEAMYISSYLKSFTNIKDKHLVNLKNFFFFIEADYNNDYCSKITFYSDIKKRTRTLKVDGEIFRRLSQYYGKNNITIFSVHDLDIINNSDNKKSFVNHISSIYDFEFITLFSHYKQLINKKKGLFDSVKKNSSNRVHLYKLIDSFNKTLSDYCAKISEIRENTLKRFIEIFNDNKNRFFPEIDIKFKYKNCIDKQCWYNRFNEKKDREIEKLMILEGVHKDSIEIFFNNMDISKNSSEGQRKIAAFLLKVSEADFIKDIKDVNPVLIFDDLNSTLDKANFNIFTEYIKAFSENQVFISFTDKDIVPLNILEQKHCFINVEMGEYL